MSLTTLSAFGPDNSVHVVVESPRGSTVKLKYDPDLNAFTLSRPLIEGLRNPTVARDDRIAPKYTALKEVRDVDSRVREELEAFFTGSVAFEGKALKLLEWEGASAAYDLVRASIAVSL